MYVQPNIRSSYKEHDLGKTLYDAVLKYKPRKIIEFGVLHGYSTVSMASAIKDLGEGKIVGYDLFEHYAYNHARMADTLETLREYRVEDVITLKRKRFEDWIRGPEEFDLIHIDVSNNGDVISMAITALQKYLDKGSVMLFEGGTPDRDQVEWMLKYKLRPIYPLKEKLGYQIINHNFPGLSLIDRNLERRRMNFPESAHQ